MNCRTVVILAVALVAAAACGNQDRDQAERQPAAPGAPPGPTEPDPVASAEPEMPDPDALTAYMKATIAAVDAAEGDCRKLAEPVVTLVRDHAQLIAEMTASSDTAAARQWKSDNLELFREFQSRLMVVAGCARGDPQLTEVLQRLSPPRPKPTPAAPPSP